MCDTGKTIRLDDALCARTVGGSRGREKEENRDKEDGGEPERRNRGEGASQTTHRNLQGNEGQGREAGRVKGWKVRAQPGQFIQANTRFWLCRSVGKKPLMLSRMHQGFSNLFNK